MNRLFKKIVHFFLLSCPEATLQIEKNLSGDIHFIQQIRLKCHLLICKWCSAYIKKCNQIHQSLHVLTHQNANQQTEHMIDKEQLKKIVSEKIKKI